MFGAVRHGGVVGANTHYRFYARIHDRTGMALPSGAEAISSPLETQTGFRIDSRPRAAEHVTVQGDYFQNVTESSSSEESSNRDINLLTRWTKELGLASELQIQGYFDRFERSVPHQMGDRRNTFDLDAQYRTGVGEPRTGETTCIRGRVSGSPGSRPVRGCNSVSPRV